MNNSNLEREQAVERLHGHVDAVRNGEVKGLSVYLDADIVQALDAHRVSLADKYEAAGVPAPTTGAMVRMFLRDSLGLNKKAVKNV